MADSALVQLVNDTTLSLSDPIFFLNFSCLSNGFIYESPSSYCHPATLFLLSLSCLCSPSSVVNLSCVFAWGEPVRNWPVRVGTSFEAAFVAVCSGDEWKDGEERIARVCVRYERVWAAPNDQEPGRKRFVRFRREARKEGAGSGSTKARPSAAPVRTPGVAASGGKRT